MRRMIVPWSGLFNTSRRTVYRKKPIAPILGSCYILPMRIIAKRTLREFWQQKGHADAQAPLEAWHAEVSKAAWTSPHEVKAQYCSASVLKNGRIVFNVGGNKYRLVVAVRFDIRIVWVRFVGTHAEYDKIDAESV